MATKFSAVRGTPVGVEFDEGTRTKQEFKNECDINRIMAKYLRTGVPPPGVGIGRYGDFSSVGDFREAQECLVRAQGQFAALPAKVREKFRNDPGEFLKFVHDEKNYDEALSLGLLKDEAVARKAAAEAAKNKPEVKNG